MPAATVLYSDPLGAIGLQSLNEYKIVHALPGKRVVRARLYLFVTEEEDKEPYSTELNLELDSPIPGLGSRSVYLCIDTDGQTPRCLSKPPQNCGFDVTELVDDQVAGRVITAAGLIEFQDDGIPTGIGIRFESGRVVYLIPNVDACTSMTDVLDQELFPSPVVIHWHSNG